MNQEPFLNISRLPSATRSRFLLILMVTISLACATAQRLKLSPEDTFGLEVPRLVVDGLIGAALALSLAVVIYLFHPVGRIGLFGRARRLKCDHPVAKRIHELSNQLGVRPPKILMDSDIRNFDAIAFGLPGRKTILLGRGNWRLLATQPNSFNGRMCHELAHIKNGDIGITFYVRALIITCIFLIFLEVARYFYPATSALLKGWVEWRSNGSTVAHFLNSWAFWIMEAAWNAIKPLAPKVLIFSMLLFFLYKAFLRAREIYADNTAAQYAGGEAMLVALGPPQLQLQPQAIALLRSLFSAHPDAIERCSAIKNPALALKPTFMQTVWLAIAVSLAITTFNNLDFTEVEKLLGVEDVLYKMISTRDGVLISLFFTILIIPSIVAISSHSFRSIAWLSVSDVGILRSITFIAINSMLLFIFLVVGFTLYNYAAALYFNFGIIDDKSIFGAIVVVVFMITVSALYFPIYRRIIRSKIPNPPSIFVWVALVVLFFQIMNWSIIIVLTKIGYDGGAYREAPVLVFVLLLLSAYFLSYLVARRSLSLKPISTDSLAPWLYTR